MIIQSFLSPIFDEFFTITRKRNNRKLIFHSFKPPIQAGSKLRGGVCISLVGKNPKDDHISKTTNLKIYLTTSVEKKMLSMEISSRVKNFLFCQHFGCLTFCLFDILSVDILSVDILCAHSPHQCFSNGNNIYILTQFWIPLIIWAENRL